MHHKRIRQESSPILHLTLQIFVQTLQASDSHHSMIVFGKACNFYHQFAIRTQQIVYFATRMKKSAVYTVNEVKRNNYRKKGQAKVLKNDEIIELEYHPEKEDGTYNTYEHQSRI
jgi:hypothetical protein